MADETRPNDEEPTAATAGEEDHEDPDSLRGEEADAPRDPDAEIDDLQFEEVEHGADQPGAGS